MTMQPLPILPKPIPAFFGLRPTDTHVLFQASTALAFHHSAGKLKLGNVATLTLTSVNLYPAAVFLHHQAWHRLQPKIANAQAARSWLFTSSAISSTTSSSARCGGIQGPC